MEQLKKIVLLHTNDIHSSFHTMPLVAGAIARLRRAHGSHPVLLADCGDHMDRMSFITEASAGEANLAVLQACGYEFIALGNNEGLTFTKERLGELFAEERGIAPVTANLRDRNTGRAPSWLHAGRIWEREGTRLGIIGATASYPIFYNLLEWQVDDPFEAVQREVHRLRDRVNAIVVLSHLGLRMDKRLAEEIDGIDIILGGHTHHVLEQPLRHASSLLCCCGSQGRYVGELELYFDAGSGRLTQVEGRLHSTAEEEPEPQVRGLIAGCSQEARRLMKQPVAVLEEALPVDWERDSPLGNLLAAGIRKQTGADIGLINSGQLLTSLLPGSISREDLLELCPSPVNTCLIRLKGGALLAALEESLLDEFVQMPLYGNGFRGKRLGGLCVDGLTVFWNPGGEPYHKISVALAGGQPLEPDREYAVGTGDMFTFGTGYLSLKEGKEPVYFLPDFLRHVLEKELNDREALQDCRRARYIIEAGCNATACPLQ